MNKPQQCFEDFVEGFRVKYTVPGLSVDEITDFAAQYDPQPFHLDEDEAARTHFGGLVASGFQTQLQCFRPLCEKLLNHSAAVGAPGIDSIRWLRPWYPGEDLDVSVQLTGKRLSSKRDDRGYISLKLEAGTSAKPLMTMEWVVIMLTRKGLADSRRQ